MENNTNRTVTLDQSDDNLSRYWCEDVVIAWWDHAQGNGIVALDRDCQGRIPNRDAMHYNRHTAWIDAVVGWVRRNG